MLYYGLDVHKKYTTYCVLDDEGKILTEGRCPNEELPHHPAFSLKGRKRAVMEAGGNWYYVYDLPEPVVDELLLAHPLRVRAIAAARVKTDAIDARTLAHLLRADLIPAAYVPPPAVRELRELLRYRLDLVKQRTAVKNRVHALLAKEGFTSPFSDLLAARAGGGWRGCPSRPLSGSGWMASCASWTASSGRFMRLSWQYGKRPWPTQPPSSWSPFPGSGLSRP